MNFPERSHLPVLALGKRSSAFRLGLCLCALRLFSFSAFAQDCGDFDPNQGFGGQIDGGSFTAPATDILDKGYFTPFWFIVDAPMLVPRTIGPTDTTETYHDRVYNVSTTTTFNDVVWPYHYEADRPRIVIPTQGTSNAGLLAPDTADPMRWTSYGSGPVTISYRTKWQEVETEVSAGTVGVVRTFSHFVQGSAAENAALNVDTRIAGRNFATSGKMYSVYQPPDYFVRNPNFWAASVDLTCLAAYNSYGWGGEGGPQRAGTLVSPRHFLCATHFLIPVGTRMYFVKQGGKVAVRTVTDYRTLGPDITVGVLDSDVPAGINFAKILPFNSYNFRKKLYAPELYEAQVYPWPVPVLNCNQFREGLVADVETWGPAGINYVCSNRPPTDPQRQLFYKDVIVGDSGSPSFVIINNTAVLLTQWTYGGAGQGDEDVYYAPLINAAMTQLGGGYQLTEIDLTAFPDF
jgi:hypothetical protein